jgi:hypothetical protein
MKKLINKITKKPITIDDFTVCIPWQQVKDKLGKRGYKQFSKWMFGQTSLPEGVYPWDLEQFLKGGKSFD